MYGEASATQDTMTDGRLCQAGLAQADKGLCRLYTAGRLGEPVEQDVLGEVIVCSAAKALIR